MYKLVVVVMLFLNMSLAKSDISGNGPSTVNSCAARDFCLSQCSAQDAACRAKIRPTEAECRQKDNSAMTICAEKGEQSAECIAARKAADDCYKTRLPKVNDCLDKYNTCTLGCRAQFPCP